MLSLDPNKLMSEITAQKRARDEKLASAEALLSKYPGSWYQGGYSSTNSDSENAAFEYVSFDTAQNVWANPRWRVSTKRPRTQQMIAEAMAFGMNRWTVDSDLKTVLEDLCVDTAFSWGVGHVTVGPRPESYEAEDPILWPQASRISPWDFGFDNRAPTWRRARMLWHYYRVDRDDLIERARLDKKRPIHLREGWDSNACRQLTPSEHRDSRLGEKQEGPDREEVELIEIFLPGHQIDGEPGPSEGFNGTIITIASSYSGGPSVFPRPPRPFFGPRWGPYTVFGTYIVPDSPYPLSLLMATAGLIDQSARLSAAVDRQVEAYKRLLLVGAQDNQLAAAIKNAPHEHVHYCRTVPNLDAMVRAFEIGGATPANVAAEQRSIQKRNRSMGLDEVQRGNVTGEGTATEVQLAVEASLSRTGYRKGRFQDAVRRMGKTVAWYLYHTDEIVYPLGPDALESMGLDPQFAEARFRGGDFEEGSGVTFDDLGLEIEPFSMERPSEAFLHQRGELLTNVIQLLPAIAQASQLGADVKGILDAYGESYGMPNLSRLFPGIDSVDPSVIQPNEAEPRLLRDAGISGLLRGMGGGPGARGSARTSAPGPQAFSSQAG